MPRLSEWPEERRRHLALLWEDRRKSLAAIARELGTNPEAVLRQAKALGLERRPTNYSRWLAARSKLLREMSCSQMPTVDPPTSVDHNHRDGDAICR